MTQAQLTETLETMLKIECVTEISAKGPLAHSDHVQVLYILYCTCINTHTGEDVLLLCLLAVMAHCDPSETCLREWLLGKWRWIYALSNDMWLNRLQTCINIKPSAIYATLLNAIGNAHRFSSQNGHAKQQYHNMWGSSPGWSPDTHGLIVGQTSKLVLAFRDWGVWLQPPLCTSCH